MVDFVEGIASRISIYSTVARRSAGPNEHRKGCTHVRWKRNGRRRRRRGFAVAQGP